MNRARRTLGEVKKIIFEFLAKRMEVKKIARNRTMRTSLQNVVVVF